MTAKEAWKARHMLERHIQPENPVAVLMDAVSTAINTYDEGRFPDSNTSRGYGEILDGIIILLNEDLGGMDGGYLWDEVAQLAEIVHWDLDMSEIAWEK